MIYYFYEVEGAESFGNIGCSGGSRDLAGGESGEL